MIHELKIWPQFYHAVYHGSKTFEVRDNDRAFQKGDTVILKEWDPTPDPNHPHNHAKGYTKSGPLRFEIGFIYVLDAHKVVFSLIEPVEDPNEEELKAML